MFGRRLADDAHQAWKWGSMRFLALGAVAQSTVIASDRLGLSPHLPEWVLSGLSGFAVFCMFAAGVSRVTTKDEPHDPFAEPTGG